MAGTENAKLVVNQHYDESLDVNDPEEIASLYSPTPRKTPTGAAVESLQIASRPEPLMEAPPNVGSEDTSLSEFDQPQAPRKLPNNEQKQLNQPGTFTDGDTDDSESSSDEDEDGDAPEGAYDPADYEHLTVSQEIKELFQYITRYTPQTIELEHKLKPFNPDYIPAVGDIDAFLKVPRPDGQPTTLGLTVLDEPCAKQSDPTVLDLQLRNISKTSGIRAMQVRSVKDADRNPKAIDAWVDSINDLHRSKPPPNVHYTKSMPDVDRLMEEWPPEIEEMLSRLQLPTANLDCNLQSYVDMICGVLDIPVYKSRIQSLHVLFSLYSAFKQNQQFQSDNIEQTGDAGEANGPEVLQFD
uniref:Intraflagellar transport protein 46 homolog n=1 Tax=Phallusia mammillata TaxID=59560 RepID=A0A6F9DFI9_9ASCI|nr:intraflagellar transport protein 46 homolog [Phallusia mammillata]